MAKRKKPGPGGVLGAVVIGALALIAAVPGEVWIWVGILAAAFTVIYLFSQPNVPRTSASIEQDKSARRISIAPARPASRAPNRPNSSSPRNLVEDDARVSVAPAPPTASGFRVPAAPKGFGAASWIPAGKSIEVAGITIPGGMVYVGRSLETPNGGNDPCLIDPSKSVASHGDYTERQMSYWPSYSDIPATARRAYLSWLAGGRSDPGADIGYVFIYFYGLERRAIIDAAKDPGAQADWPAIAAEIRRLLSIYGEKSSSFRRYASELLN